MERKIIIGIAIVFFLFVNTLYFFEGNLGFFIGLTLFFSFFILCVLLLAQFLFAINERFKNKQRFLTVFVLFVVIGTAYCRPTGLINYEAMTGKDALVAYRGGVAGCHTVLRLKANGRYHDRHVCFGVYRYSGRYQSRNDTVFFSKSDKQDGFSYDFALTDSSNRNHPVLRLYNTGDTAYFSMDIEVNRPE
jgi:hypothetical protein